MAEDLSMRFNSGKSSIQLLLNGKYRAINSKGISISFDTFEKAFNYIRGKERKFLNDILNG